MPKVCAFSGVSVWIYYDDHPQPHFHVRYAGQRARVGIDPVLVLAGELPVHVTRQVLAWARERQSELADAWERAEQLRPMKPIEPLES